MPTTKPPRNRAGRNQVNCVLSAEASEAIAEIAAHRASEQGSCTRAQAVEWALRETAKRIRKKK